MIMATPIHRESLVCPRPLQDSHGIYISMMPATTDSVSPANQPRMSSQSLLQENNGTSNSNNLVPPAPWSPWMVNFCTEPRGDADACCLAFWLDPVAYGKTQARFSQKSLLLDINDEKATNGCNQSCGIYCALKFVMLEWILIGFQRTRTRALYSIEGSLSQDFIQAFFCRSCTLVQNDREVRAREGNINLRTNHFYDNIEMGIIDEQPSLISPMRCVSPRPDPDQRDEIAELYPNDSKIQGIASLQRPKPWESKTCKISKCRAGKLKKKAKAPKNLPSTAEERVASFSFEDSPTLHRAISFKPQNTNEPRTDNNGQIQTMYKSKAISRLSNRDLGSYDSYVHDFTDCPIDKAMLEHFENETRLTEHELSACQVAPESFSNADSGYPHGLDACIGKTLSQEEADIGLRLSETHRTEECTKEISGYEEHKLNEHRMSSCISDTESNMENNIMKARQRSISAPVKSIIDHDFEAETHSISGFELSTASFVAPYPQVHHITSCIVAENSVPNTSDVKQHLTPGWDYVQSTKPLLNVSIHQLENCVSDSTSSMAIGTDQHYLSSCPTVSIEREDPKPQEVYIAGSVSETLTHENDQKLEKHGIVGCSTLPIDDTEPSIAQHRIISCMTEDASESETYTDLNHPMSECLTLAPTNAGLEVLKNRIIPGGLDAQGKKSHLATQQDTTKDSSRNSVQDEISNQHRLSSCIPENEVTSNTGQNLEHQLTGCPALGSIEIISTIESHRTVSCAGGVETRVPSAIIEHRSSSCPIPSSSGSSRDSHDVKNKSIQEPCSCQSKRLYEGRSVSNLIDRFSQGYNSDDETTRLPGSKRQYRKDAENIAKTGKIEAADRQKTMRTSQPVDRSSSAHSSVSHALANSPINKGNSTKVEDQAVNDTYIPPKSEKPSCCEAEEGRAVNSEPSGLNRFFTGGFGLKGKGKDKDVAGRS